MLCVCVCVFNLGNVGSIWTNAGAPYTREAAGATAGPGLAGPREWLLGARARFGMETTFQSGSPARLGGKSLASETRQARAQTASPAYRWGGLGELAGPLALSFLFRKSRAPVAIGPPAIGLPASWLTCFVTVGMFLDLLGPQRHGHL